MLITPERKVPQRSDTSQNDHKSKGYPSKTSAAAFTMQKSDKGDLKKSNFSALVQINDVPLDFGQHLDQVCW